MMSPFASLIGQPQAIELLTQAVQRDRVAPAYLFAGANGVGRRVAATCFIQLLCQAHDRDPASLSHRIQQRNHPDILWVEPTYLHQGKRLSATEAAEAGIKRKTAPLIRLEQIREISQFLARPPLTAPRSVVILDQAETMAEAAANGLLKTLEEPGKATLILLAPSPEVLLPTLVSRCQRIPFYRLSTAHLAQVLQTVDYSEILQHPQVLQLAQGSPGEAIAHWQRLQEIPATLLERISQPPQTLWDAMRLAREIHNLDFEAQLWLVDFCQQSWWQSEQTANRLLSLQVLEEAREHLRRSVQPRLVWEVTLMRLMAG